jgi:hypothetical protein
VGTCIRGLWEEKDIYHLVYSSNTLASCYGGFAEYRIGSRVSIPGWILWYVMPHLPRKSTYLTYSRILPVGKCGWYNLGRTRRQTERFRHGPLLSCTFPRPRSRPYHRYVSLPHLPSHQNTVSDRWIGGFLGLTAGWRWVEGFLAIFCGIISIILFLFSPETYAPYLLRKRAATLSQVTGKVYRFRGDAKGLVKVGALFQAALLRPWKFLIFEVSPA